MTSGRQGRLVADALGVVGPQSPGSPTRGQPAAQALAAGGPTGLHPLPWEGASGGDLPASSPQPVTAGSWGEHAAALSMPPIRQSLGDPQGDCLIVLAVRSPCFLGSPPEKALRSRPGWSRPGPSGLRPRHPGNRQCLVCAEPPGVPLASALLSQLCAHRRPWNVTSGESWSSCHLPTIPSHALPILGAPPAAGPGWLPVGCRAPPGPRGRSDPGPCCQGLEAPP